MGLKGVLHTEPKEETPLSAKNWVRSGTPATDEEIKQSATEAEQSTYFLSIEEARQLSHQRFSIKWK